MRCKQRAAALQGQFLESGSGYGGAFQGTSAPAQLVDDDKTDRV